MLFDSLQNVGYRRLSWNGGLFWDIIISGLAGSLRPVIVVPPGTRLGASDHEHSPSLRYEI